MNRRPVRRWLCMFLLIGGLSLSCGREVATRLAVDLSTVWPFALVATESGVMDIGTTEARPFQGKGWYYDERNRGSGETFAWSRGGSSEIVFHLGWKRELNLGFRCRPFRFPGAVPQTVSFVLNGHAVVEVEDDGPGIEPAQREAVLARGVRTDSTVPGQGIGLAVVRDIVQAYGGHVGINQSAALGGACISLHLPTT